MSRRSHPRDDFELDKSYHRDVWRANVALDGNKGNEDTLRELASKCSVGRTLRKLSPCAKTILFASHARRRSISTLMLFAARNVVESAPGSRTQFDAAMVLALEVCCVQFARPSFSIRVSRLAMSVLCAQSCVSLFLLLETGLQNERRPSKRFSFDVRSFDMFVKGVRDVQSVF